ncbi:MAG: threonine-phosphate decarboxylase CobD [Bacillota bacterium]|uniref:threonine-phosphate decarboxylase CobD n=1 Tax=Desulfurispora thermophila TaxID=265470 RepID=UPI00037D3F45|nr:threonine-phosphate decarboxylase CobD [Desulfurispora thermophila]
MTYNNPHGGDLKAAAGKYGRPEKDWLDFSASINPLGPSPAVARAVQEEFWRVMHYPDPYCRELTGQLAAYLGLPPEYLLTGNGAAELIYLLPRALRISRALVVAPTFSLYARSVEAGGGRVDYFLTEPAGGFEPVLDKLAARLAGYDALYICNPNNPTGVLLSPDKLQWLAGRAAEAGCFLVVDEAFIDFVPEPPESSLLPVLPRQERMIVLYSLTKFFALPGLRLGAVAAAPPLLAQLRRVKDPWSVNALAQVAALAALGDGEHIQASRQAMAHLRRHLTGLLSSLPGLKVWPTTANFVLLQLEQPGLTADVFTDALARRGVLVRNAANFAGLDDKYIRVAVRSEEENAVLCRAMQEVLAANA